MRTKHATLIGALSAAVAGCAARAETEPRAADGQPVVVRFDTEALRAQMAPDRRVSVVGTARVSVVPDLAEITLGVSTSKPTAPEAVAANNAAMAALVEAINKRGIAPKDIQTSQISITPQYPQQVEFVMPQVQFIMPNEAPDEPAVVAPAPVPAPALVPAPAPDAAGNQRVIGYDVVNSVRVTVRDLTKLGTLIDDGVKAGSNQGYGIAFRIEDREAVLTELRGKALDAAKAKADLYARRAGAKLGPVIQITESDAGWFAPAPATFGAPMAPAPGGAPPMPVSAGQEEVSLSVSVSYELK